MQAKRLLLTFVIAAALATAAHAQGGWWPVTPEELKQDKPSVEPDADAEAIFWQVKIDNKNHDKTTLEHYVRVKIFNERGRQKFSKVELPYSPDGKVDGIAARVLNPNGSIVYLQDSDIFDREIIKLGGEALKAKSFAVPGIESGAILEYQYREVVENYRADGERIYFQLEIPVQKFIYMLRAAKEDLPIVFEPHNMEEIKFVEDGDGFYVGTRTNVPALKAEPKMPPLDQVRQWVLIRYKNRYMFSWPLFGVEVSNYFDVWTKPTKDLAEKARTLTEGARTDDEKLLILYDFVKKNLRNKTYDRTIPESELKKALSRRIDDLLKARIGTSYQIDRVFAAMAKSVGFVVNEVYSGNRENRFFNPEVDISRSYLKYSGMAVKRGDTWVIYRPGVPFMPAGMTFWQNEIIPSFLGGERSYTWLSIPMADYKRNSTKRKARLKLLEDGTIEGNVEIAFDGHPAIDLRSDMFQKTPNERETQIRTGWRSAISTGEFSDISVQDFDEPQKPLSFKLRLRVPNYAQKTGKRIFLQPGLFKYGIPPLFSSETRLHPIYFEYPWSEQDDVEIELPAGYEPDGLEPPNEVRESTGIMDDKIDIEFDKKSRTIRYKRDFFFGSGKLLYAPTAYKPLKFLFDAAHKADSYSVSLRQAQ